MEDNENEQVTDPVSEEEPVQNPQPEQGLPKEDGKSDKKAGKDQKNPGLLMPVLYALLAAIGAFTLVMFIGIGIAFFKYRASPPSDQPSYEESVPPSDEVTSAPS